MMRYIVATHCKGCDKRYTSRVIEDEEVHPPVRCKHCKSSRTEIVENPEEHPEFALDNSVITVRR